MKDINEKKICIFGTGGTGKTEFVKDLWTKFKIPLAYDINGDFEKCKGGISYQPKKVNQKNLLFFLDKLYINSQRKIDAIFFDDADAYMDYELMNDDFFNDLVIRQRNHYKVSLIFISKRPQNIPTKIVDNSHINIIFKVNGHNAIKRVNDIHEDIDKLRQNLKPFHYIQVEENQQPIIKEPIKIK